MTPCCRESLIKHREKLLVSLQIFVSALAQKNPTASLTRMVKNDIRRGRGYSGLLAKVIIIRSEVTGRKVNSKIMPYIVLCQRLRDQKEILTGTLRGLGSMLLNHCLEQGNCKINICWINCPLSLGKLLTSSEKWVCGIMIGSQTWLWPSESLGQLFFLKNWFSRTGWGS